MRYYLCHHYHFQELKMGSKDNGELFEENIRLKQSVTNIKRSLDAVSVESMDDIKALEIRKGGCCYKVRKFLMRPAFLIMVIALLIAGVAMYFTIVNYKTSKAGLKASNTAVAKAQVAEKNAKHAEATAAEAAANKEAESDPQGCGSGTKKTFPDIDYALFGYNILKGYPMAVGHDPGLTRPIFKADYRGKRHSADCKYKIPRGLTVVPDVSCVTSFTSDVIRDKYQLTKSLDASAEVSGGGWGAEFSASVQYKTKSNSVQSKESVFINSVAKCDYYLSVMDDVQPPPLDESFIMKVKTLKTVNDVFKLFEYYGTHYLKTTTFGARLIFESKMKKSDYNSMKSKNVNVALSGSYSGIVRVSGKASLNVDEQKQANNFRQKTETKTISVGAPPPADGKTETWASEVKETPVPTKYKMASIEDLFTKKFMGHLINNTDDLQKLVKDGRKAYCRYLKTKGSVDSCKKIQSYVNFKDLGFEHTTWLETFKGDSVNDCIKSCLNDRRCVATVCPTLLTTVSIGFEPLQDFNIILLSIG